MIQISSAPADEALLSSPTRPHFADLGLSQELLRSLGDMGFEWPTPVQCEAIPSLLAGRDVVAQALTGTGKTAAFAIPIIERIQRGGVAPHAVVLAPTRELAVQVAKEIVRIGQRQGPRVLALYGGQPYDRQLKALKQGVDVLVATPGRLMDHMRNGKVDLSQVATLVLDEADEMLNMGFLEDVELIIGSLPLGRQTALFSATMPQPILILAQKYMTDPIRVRLRQPREMTAPNISHGYYLVPFKRKFVALTRLLRLKRPERSLIFAATKRMVDELVEGLQAAGFSADFIHSDISQAQRERVMAAFRSGRLPILVATDVAARGIDVDNVTHVINFDIPREVEHYVHRIGRTGRVGRSGEALTLVNPWEERQLKVIERTTGARIVKGELPSEAEVEALARSELAGLVRDRLQNGKLEAYRALVEQARGEAEPADVAAAALALLDARHAASTPTQPAELPGEVAAGTTAARRFERQGSFTGNPRFAGRRANERPPFRRSRPWRA